MNDFTNQDKSLPELVIQGISEPNVYECCNEEMLAMVESWRSRESKYSASAELFNRDDTQVFAISYRGEADSYWPTSEANMFAEALIRDVVYKDGICTLEGFEPRMFKIKFHVVVMQETEYLLVLPYSTESGNIGGLTVVCVNNYLK